MDKIKAIGYTVFVKHLFWTLSICVILLGFAGWWMSSGKLKQDFDKNLTTVSTNKDSIQALVSKPEIQIYNKTSHDGMKEMNAERRREVLLAWQSKYDKQRKEVLVWPEGLSKKFTAAIEDVLKGRPIEEVKPKADGTDHLVFQLREEYRNEIKGLLPKLAEMINAEWNPQATDTGRSGRGGFGGRQPPLEGGAAGVGGAAKPEKEYAVQWSTADQGDIQQTHFDWSDSDEPPTTMEILYSTEDYWVLKALMQIVARTNLDEETGLPADQPHRAAIREILSIKIGSAAENNLGQVYAVAAPAGEGEAAAGGVTGGTTGAVAPPPTSATGEGMLEGATGVTAATGPDPAEGRYVDKAYVPLPAAKLKSAAESGDALEAYLAVAKRMPVRMQVKMDQRKLNKFLVECGNADLMLEVKQVRVNPDAPDIVSLAGTSGRGGGGGAFGNGGAGRLGNGRGGAGEGGAESDAKYPWDVVVEIYGIIYIFNPPSITRLTDKLEPEDVAKFEASIKQVTSAKTSDTALANPVGETTRPADETESAEAEAADDQPPASADDPPATEVPPVKEKPAAKPPTAADAAKSGGALAPAG